jgi:hypothetical protein
MIVSYYVAGSACSATMTAIQSVSIDGQEYYANPETFTESFQAQIFVTHHYTAVTLTSLRPLDTLIFVLSSSYN